MGWSTPQASSGDQGALNYVWTRTGSTWGHQVLGTLAPTDPSPSTPPAGCGTDCVGGGMNDIRQQGEECDSGTANTECLCNCRRPASEFFADDTVPDIQITVPQGSWNSLSSCTKDEYKRRPRPARCDYHDATCRIRYGVFDETRSCVVRRKGSTSWRGMDQASLKVKLTEGWRGMKKFSEFGPFRLHPAPNDTLPSAAIPTFLLRALHELLVQSSLFPPGDSVQQHAPGPNKDPRANGICVLQGCGRYRTKGQSCPSVVQRGGSRDVLPDHAKPSNRQ